jgi:hypothetical protein
VCTGKLNPDVVVMRSAEDRVCLDVADTLTELKAGAALSSDRCVLMPL